MCTVRPATINDARRLKCCMARFKTCSLKDRSDADWNILHERIKNKALFVCVQRDVIVAYASVTKYCNRHQLLSLRWRTHILTILTRVRVALKV